MQKRAAIWWSWSAPGYVTGLGSTGDVPGADPLEATAPIALGRRRRLCALNRRRRWRKCREMARDPIERLPSHASILTGRDIDATVQRAQQILDVGNPLFRLRMRCKKPLDGIGLAVTKGYRASQRT